MFLRVINNRVVLIFECDKVYVYIYIELVFFLEIIEYYQMFYIVLVLLYRMDRDESRVCLILLYVFIKRIQCESILGFDCFLRCFILVIIGEFGKYVQVFLKSVFRVNNVYRLLLFEFYESFYFKYDFILNVKKY